MLTHHVLSGQQADGATDKTQHHSDSRAPAGRHHGQAQQGSPAGLDGMNLGYCQAEQEEGAARQLQ